MYQYLIFINPSKSNAYYFKIIKRSGCDASDRFFLKNNDQNEDCILDDLDPYDNNDDSNSNYNESNTDSGNEEL